MKATVTLTLFLFTISLFAQSKYYLQADRVFDGQEMREGWAVLIDGNKIVAAGPSAELKAPKDATILRFPNSTLLPG